MSKWTKVSIFVTVVLVGIPTAAGFYPPLFAGLAEYLPLNLVFAWMNRFGIFILGILIGWSARGVQENNAGRERDADASGTKIEREDGGDVTVETIEGCIEVGETCWRGTAELSNRHVSNTRVAYKAICPHCQTVMYDGESNTAGVATTGTTVWTCANCGHTAVDGYSQYKDAKNLFDSDIRRIIESEGKEYSLDALVKNITEEVTPRGVWKQYARVKKDKHVSTNCFH